MKFMTSIDKEKTWTIELDYTPIDGTPAEVRERLGESVMHEHAVDSIVIALQSNVRRWKRAGKSDEEIAKLAAEWRPGVKGPRVAKSLTPEDIKKAMATMTPEQLANIRAALDM